MPAADLTKRILADGLKQIMQTIPLNNISVGDITKHCGISRNTFYYHFQDKYDLVNWIFYTEITPQISNFTDLNNWSDGLIALGNYMQKNKLFYINALSVDGQNSLSECLMQYYQSLIENTLRAANAALELSKLQVTVIARFYTHAIIGSILDWARNGMKNDPKESINLMVEAISGNIFKKAFDELHNREEKS